MSDNLPCEDAAGSLVNEPNIPPLVVVAPCVGTWEISGQDDLCAQTETKNHEGYAAEIININGAPLRIYKLLGVHEQGDGSIISQGTLFTSQSAPGFPASNINVNGQSWRSFSVGSLIAGQAYVGVDFGIDTKHDGSTEYLPTKPNWKKIGAVSLTQGNTVNNFARQVRVEVTDGSVKVGAAQITGDGNGQIIVTPEARAQEGSITVAFNTPTTFSIFWNNSLVGSGTVGVAFKHPIFTLTINQGTTPWSDELISVPLNYVWKRAGVYNLVQSASPIVLGFQSEIQAKAIRVVPTLFTGSGNWEVVALDVLDSVPTNINNIQDLFFNENRDRDYAKTALQLKAQYQINSSISDLSKFGLNILDQYSFVVSFPIMVELLGRPIVTGDIIEVTTELQYDQNLKPVRKFLEVTDTGWASEGFSPRWKPTLYRFAAQQALPSQETRDIFGTVDTHKYLVADSFFDDLGVGSQIDTTPLTQTEEVNKKARKAVPETGDDYTSSTDGTKMPIPIPPVTEKGNPPAEVGNGKQGIYIEDGLPPNGEPYGEGYTLPDATTVSDGDYFRLYYPESTGIPARLYRFSAVKNKWVFLETDRRGEQSSLKPSVRSILQSPTKVGLKKKQI
jgi:hypothetical protein